MIGAWLSDLLSLGIEQITDICDKGLTAYGINPVVHSLIIDGVFAGVGSVLSFLPIIVVLFFFLSILEDSGYMARVAFVMDKLLTKDRTFREKFCADADRIWMYSSGSYGNAGHLSSERDRKMTIMLTPFISCSAKIPIYAVFTAAFFPKICSTCHDCTLCNRDRSGNFGGTDSKRIRHFSGNPIPFVMELPNYRLPSVKSVLQLDVG